MKGVLTMKKSNLYIGICYTVIGLIFLAAAFLNTPLGALFCGFAGGGIGSGVMMICRYVYWTRPQNRKRYEKKLEEDTIEQRDERKELLRGKAARYVFGMTLVVLSLSCILFSILGKLGIIGYSRSFVIYLACLFLFEMIAFQLVYWRLNKKY